MTTVKTNGKPRRKKRYLYAHPITGAPISRQRIWQINQKAKGKCIICGNPSKTYRCKGCNKDHLERQKK